MHAVIYGTGKWAQLLKIKLKSFDIDSILIGNNPLVADYNRAEMPYVAKTYQNCLVFIASATVNHFKDITHSGMFYPSKIFIEKGFSNFEEKASAKSWANDKQIPAYILSQYRYSKILEILEPFKENVVNIVHDWTIDKGLVSEWMYHIISVDNYIKNSSNQFYTNNEGSYILDSISSVRITRGNVRDLKTVVKTKDETIVLNFGITNSIHIKSNHGIDAYSYFENEDCITSQLKDIIKNTENLRLERL